MSTRAIAPIVGASDFTVSKDLQGVRDLAPDAGPRQITGRDGTALLRSLAMRVYMSLSLSLHCCAQCLQHPRTVIPSSPVFVRGASGRFFPDERGASGPFDPDRRSRATVAIWPPCGQGAARASRAVNPSSPVFVRGTWEVSPTCSRMSFFTVQSLVPTTGAIARDDKQRPPQHPVKGAPGRGVCGKTAG